MRLERVFLHMRIAHAAVKAVALGQETFVVGQLEQDSTMTTPTTPSCRIAHIHAVDGLSRMHLKRVPAVKAVALVQGTFVMGQLEQDSTMTTPSGRIARVHAVDGLSRIPTPQLDKVPLHQRMAHRAGQAILLVRETPVTG
jgi:hypothetical protein